MLHVISHFILTVVAMALTASALRYVTDFWLLSFVYSFQTHIGAMAAIICLPFLLAKRYRICALLLMAVAVFLLAHSILLKGYLDPRPPVAIETPRFRLMEFNILSSNVENGGRIADLIENTDVDAAVILEARPLRDHLARLRQAYPYQAGCGTQTPTCDLLILSRWPLRDSRFQTLGDFRTDRLATAIVEHPDGPVTLVGVHLTKPYYDQHHSNELQRLRQAIRRMSGPIVLAGDFNSSVIAPGMQSFLRSTGLRAARGEPATWPVRLAGFGIGIDHIFVSDPLQIVEMRRLPDSMGSNHFGLIADIAR